MGITQMRMLRWMCSKIRKYRIRNVNIRDMIGVTLIEDKLRNNRFRLFGHIYRRLTNVIARISDIIIGSDNTRGRSESKLTLDAAIKKNMIGLNFGEYLTLYRD